MSPRKNSIRLVSFLAILFILCVGFRVILSSSSEQISLSQSTGLSGSALFAYKSFSSATSSESLENFSVIDSWYSSDKKWAVAKIESGTVDEPNAATVIFHQVYGVYQPFLGPGTSFSANSVSDLGNEVINYLYKQKVVADE